MPVRGFAPGGCARRIRAPDPSAKCRCLGSMSAIPSIRLTGWTKAGIVLAGYVLAFFASVAATASYDRQFTPADNQAMGGMIAGGEMMYGSGVFLFLALFPTGLGIWFVRKLRPFWSAF